MRKTASHLFFIGMGCLLSSNIQAQNLKEHKWENRILIIYSTDKEAGLYQEQIREFLNEDAELKDRKMVIYRVVNDQYQLVNYTKRTQGEWTSVNGKFKGVSFKDVSFKVALVGLDGRVKLEQESILNKTDLYSIIDSMPMRADELRNRRKED